MLRKEISGSPTEQLEFVSCRHFKIKIRQEQTGTGPCFSIRRPHNYHPWGQGDLSDHTCTERILRGQRMEGMPAHIMACQPSRNPCAGIHIGYKTHMHSREGPD